MTGPTAYARLMDKATHDPLYELRGLLEQRLRALGCELHEQFTEQMRAAYLAGITDGYAERVREEAQEHRGSSAEARVKELETALGYIALEDEGEEYDLPDWDIIQQFPREFRAPAIARVLLAGGQEKATNLANPDG